MSHQSPLTPRRHPATRELCLLLITAALLALAPVMVSAQELLFRNENTRSLRQAAAAPAGVSHRQRVELSATDTSFFQLPLEGELLTGLSQNNRSALSRQGTKSTRGVLLNDLGERVGSYVSTEVEREDTSTVHMLFRLDHSGAHYALKTGEDGSYYFDAYDHDAMPGCGHDHHEVEEIAGRALRSEEVAPLSTRSSAVTLDLLVLYTPEAVEYAGGTAAMEALIGQAIELSNESYENSQVALQLRTVHVAQTTDNESGSLVEDLTNLQGSTDGSFDEAHTLRNTYGADMVVLMTAPGDYCGIGYSPSTVAGLASGTYAFSVVASNCVDYYSFQHEVGHNLGLQHDPDNAPEATAYEGSYGHRWNAEESGLQYRSVMAYAPGTRVPYFSNPDVSHEGSRTGLSTEADNASTLSIVSAVAANYRATASLPEVEEGEEEEEEEEEEENGGETTEGGNENGGEVESPSGNETPETLTVDQESTRRATTFELVVTDTEGAALANVEVSFFLLKKNGNRKLLSTVTTDALGGYSYRIKKRRKKQKIVISTEGLPEIFETIRKKKGKRNRRRRR